MLILRSHSPVKILPSSVPRSEIEQVLENRKQEKKISFAAKAALIAIERAASARAIAAAAQDSTARRQRDEDLDRIEEACQGG